MPNFFRSLLSSWSLRRSRTTAPESTHDLDQEDEPNGLVDTGSDSVTNAAQAWEREPVMPADQALGLGWSKASDLAISNNSND